MHQTKFITLGTAGGPTPKLERSPPAHAIVRDGKTILVDCGEGAFGQLRRAGIDMRNVHEIVLSHHHFDHIGSLFACLGLNMMLHRHEPLNLYGPPGTCQIIESLVSACNVPQQIGYGVPGQTLPHPRDFVNIREIVPGDTIDINDIKVSCCENTHYRPEEQFGQEGPLSLSLRFDAEDRSMVFTGDTGPCRSLEAFAADAQLLVGEMMDAEKIVQRIRDTNPQMSEERIDMMGKHLREHHLSGEDLGALASRANVEQVVAVHIPLDSMNADTESEYVQKIASRFSGKISIGEDLGCY